MRKVIKALKERYKTLEQQVRANEHKEIKKHSVYIGKIIKTQRLREDIIKLKQ